MLAIREHFVFSLAEKIISNMTKCQIGFDQENLVKKFNGIFKWPS